MKYMKKVVGVIAVLAMLVGVASAATPSTNTVAQVTDKLGPWTFSLSGGGSSALSDNKIANSAIGGEFAIGHKANLILPGEIGIRQFIGYSDADGSKMDYSTKLFADVTVIRLGNLEADAGANVGANYGSQSEVFTAAPEVVARLYLKKDVDLFGRVEYPFDLTKGTSADTLNYTIGLRVRF